MPLPGDRAGNSLRSAASASPVGRVGRELEHVAARRATSAACRPEAARARGDRVEHRLHVGGELAMTLRISAVAVCRSSASLVSLNRRTFSIAITAWSAKVLSSSI
jgi:hypothetical protein